MRMNRRRILLRSGSVVMVLLGAQPFARAAGIVAVRLWPAADYTRLTIESDAALRSRQVDTGDAARLALDIEGLAVDPALRELVAKVRTDDPYIRGIRVVQHTPQTVRLSIDLKQPAAPQVFSLSPVAAYQHRLVLDLHPQQAADPLQAFLAERLKERAAQPPTAGATPAASAPMPAATASAPAVAVAPAHDPLGDLIARHGERLRTPAETVAAARARPAAPVPAAARQTPLKAPPPVDKTNRMIVVALDPGHGGEDPGAIGPSGTREKDVVLRIALLLRDRINATTVDGNPMRAFLTRDGDYFVPLGTRVQKARRVQADLFVSIHADAFTTPAARGASVFALSQNGASSTAARWLANKENNADLIGGVNIKTQEAHVVRAMLDMSTTAQINDSLKLGSALLGEIGNVGRLHKPRVEQAGFAVLKAPDIPSVLVETAFISNPEEEARLRSERYQEQLADALMRGIERYFARNPPLARTRSM